MQRVPQRLSAAPGGLMSKLVSTGPPETQAQPQPCSLEQALGLGKPQFPQG